MIAGEGWHRGVIGIAASKIAERINRPCVVLSIDGEVAHGSGRSIEPYHLLNGLTSCADLFEKFGGHSHAAGITIKPDRIAGTSSPAKRTCRRVPDRGGPAAVRLH